MNIQTPSLTLARAFTLVAMTTAMASAALAQQSNTSTGSSSGVTNMSAPQSVAPVSAAPAAAPAVPALAAVTQVPSSTSLNPPATNRVGDATSYLLALQAGGHYASRNAYPVTSDVAQRTYARYLESFTHKIPESSDSQVGSSSGGRR
ncbi:DUF3613 domain-containing protein [Comamonas sp. 26]|uniref:DUF3613 domain-containing protein n=1 Tax=Comamonas sp. 26 TaxID=2035201 RepID=UPI000C194B34|nr:DUF3613 domain-containing protein [Comamonas sp. 26]PIG07271.1 uncharacterized protein DUF3613 [Comamonas sp. 26]